MTRLRSLVTMALITPMAGVAILGASAPAQASNCIGTASIISGPGSYPTGSTVSVSAKMDTVKASLYVAGPGGDWDIGSAILGGTVRGTVHPSLPGTYTLTITGDITGCTFASSSFRVTSPATHTPSPGHSKGGSTSHNSGSSNTGTSTVPNGSSNVPNSGSNDYPNLTPQNSGTSLNLPSVAPDGTGDFQYPATGQNPQVASPAARQRLASNEQSTNPVQWGRSVAIALVLLLMSAHLTMWNRRHRVSGAAAVAARRASSTPKPAGAGRSSAITKMTGLGRRFGLLTSETAPPQHAAETVVSAATDNKERDGSSTPRRFGRRRRS